MRTWVFAVLVAGFISVGCGDGTDSPPPPTTAKAGAAVKVTPHSASIPRNADDAKMLALLKARTPPDAEIYKGGMVGHKVDPTGQFVTFEYAPYFKSKSSSQVGEVSLALQIKSMRSGLETYLSDPQTITEFHSDRLPNTGALEAFSRTSLPSKIEFTIPNHMWTTDANIGVIITKQKAVTDEHDLHNFGNLMSFMMWHNDKDIEAAFLKDPSLFKLKNSEGTNVAMVAINERGPALTKFMLAHGVPKSDKTRAGYDLMYCAVHSDTDEMLAYVAKLGFSVNEAFGPQRETPLMAAVTGICPHSVSWLLAHGANPNAKNPEGDTPLSLCLASPDIQLEGMFDELVAAKADIHYRYPNGDTLLHRAVETYDMWSMKRLVELGLDVNSVNKDKVAPLMLAAAGAETEQAKWLIAQGADTHAVDAKGQSIFDYAKMSNTLHSDRFFRQELGL